MMPFDLPICPCCTGALLHTLAQTSGSWSNPQVFLELGKGSLVDLLTRIALSGGGQENLEAIEIGETTPN